MYRAGSLRAVAEEISKYKLDFDKVKEDEMGRAYSTDGEEEECI
jgi:hypothetical protein